MTERRKNSRVCENTHHTQKHRHENKLIKRKTTTQRQAERKARTPRETQRATSIKMYARKKNDSRVDRSTCESSCGVILRTSVTEEDHASAVMSYQVPISSHVSLMSLFIQLSHLFLSLFGLFVTPLYHQNKFDGPNKMASRTGKVSSVLKANSKTKLINSRPRYRQSSKCLHTAPVLAPSALSAAGTMVLLETLRRPSGKARRPQPRGCALTLHVAPVLTFD